MRTTVQLVTAFFWLCIIAEAQDNGVPGVNLIEDLDHFEQMPLGDTIIFDRAASYASGQLIGLVGLHKGSVSFSPEFLRSSPPPMGMHPTESSPLLQSESVLSFWRSTPYEKFRITPYLVEVYPYFRPPSYQTKCEVEVQFGDEPPVRHVLDTAERIGFAPFTFRGTSDRTRSLGLRTTADGLYVTRVEAGFWGPVWLWGVLIFEPAAYAHDRNAARHNTSDFRVEDWTLEERKAVTRRGEIFQFHLLKSEQLELGDEWEFRVYDMRSGSRVFDFGQPAGGGLQWSLPIPTNAPIGDYYITGRNSKNFILNRLAFRVLFNPWLKGNPEYANFPATGYLSPPVQQIMIKPDARVTLRMPYVLAQHSKTVSDAAMYLIKGLSVDGRRSPFGVATELNALCAEENATTEILNLKWPGPENGSRLTSIPDIIDRWRAAKVAPKDDRFSGQCPDAAALCTSLLRSVGIASRPVTGCDFVTSDKDGHPGVNQYYTAAWYMIQGENPPHSVHWQNRRTLDCLECGYPGRCDIQWGYHVWVEGFFANSGTSEWMAMDPCFDYDPVEVRLIRESFYAAPADIKSRSLGGFHAAVHGAWTDYFRDEDCRLLSNLEGGGRKSFDSPPTMFTFPGGLGVRRQEVTTFYRPVAASPSSLSALTQEDAPALELSYRMAVTSVIDIKNSAPNDTAFRLHRTILPTDHTGLPLSAPVFATISTVDSVPGMPLAIPLEYGGEVTQALGLVSGFAEESLILTDKTDTDVKAVIIRRLRLERPPCVLTLAPELPQAGSAIQCRVSWTNWTGATLTNALFALRWYGVAGPLVTTTGSNDLSIARIEPGATWTNSFVITQSARNPGFAHATLLHEAHVLAQAEVDIPVVGPQDLEFVRESDGRCYLRFDSKADLVYQIEYADRLQDSSWKSLGKVLGLGGRMDVRVPSLTQSAMRFYRLKIISFSP